VSVPLCIAHYVSDDREEVKQPQDDPDRHGGIPEDDGGPGRGTCAGLVRTADGDVAFVHGLARMGAVGQFSMWLRVTFGPRKRDGAWQITYERESMPFYMDDFRAATDLEP
jgi:ketosteroid isomerase-like protein